MKLSQRMKAAWAVLSGESGGTAAAPGDAEHGTEEPQLDLRAREAEMAKLRAEVGRLAAQAERAAENNLTDREATAAHEMGFEVARLRLELKARDEEIAKLRAEFSRQESQAAAATAAAGREALAELCRALAPVLSQLATLRHIAESGREVRATDALKLCGKVEQALLERGLERIGEVGAESPFDPSVHQRMSGGDVRDGDRVRVRFVGYRFATGAPVKALVSRVQDSAMGSGAPEETE